MQIETRKPENATAVADFGENGSDVNSRKGGDPVAPKEDAKTHGSAGASPSPNGQLLATKPEIQAIFVLPERHIYVRDSADFLAL
ncbi:MAG: hypothetical protein O2856_14705 [Planctomycetota bacterium]|nr:hypothetical protein [Planctomycetota bacterium]